MGISNTRNVVLLLILIAGVMTMEIETAFGKNTPPVANNNNSSCNWDMANFAFFCTMYMHTFPEKIQNPDKACCAHAQKANIAQFCKMFVQGNEQIISGSKVAHIARYCRHPLPAGSKCGSKSIHFLYDC